MALYHFCVAQIKRSAGSSVVASAAYRAGEKLHSERYDEYNDYSRKGGVLFSEILLPANAPPEYADRETLWNAVEAAEKRDDAQLAYSFDFALQNEFTYEENLAIAQRFIRENFLSRGMIVDYAVHDPDREPGGIPNPHVHVLVPMRPLNPDGIWGAKQKQVPVLDENGNRVWDEKYQRYKFQAVHTTDWNTPETLEEWRKNWCDIVNAQFEEKGLPDRIDHRSYERQGLDLLAQVHEGPAVRAMEKKGIPTQKGDFNRWVKATNALIKSLREKIAGLMEWLKEAKAELEKPQAKTLAELITAYMELQRQGAQNFSKYGRRKANITTLKDAADILIYLNENHLDTAAQLEEKLTVMTADMDAISESMKEKTERIKVLKAAIEQAKVYQEQLPVFQKMGKPKYKFKKAKDAYREQHDGELRLFYRARRVIKEAGMPDHYDPTVMAAWQRELAKLSREYNNEYERLKPIREEQQKLSHIQYCVDRVRRASEELETTMPEQRHEAER